MKTGGYLVIPNSQKHGGFHHLLTPDPRRWFFPLMVNTADHGLFIHLKTSEFSVQSLKKIGLSKPLRS